MNTKLKKRNEIENKYKWNINDLIGSDNLWQNEYDNIIIKIQNFKKYKNNVTDSSKNLLECLNESNDLSKQANTMYVYAQMKLHEDTTNSFYQALADKAETLIINLSSELSFIEPKIISLGQDKIYKYMNECEDLKIYSHYFDNLLRQKNHILSEDKELILSQVQELAQIPENIYSMLNNADMKFATIKNEENQDIEITHGRYLTLLESPNRKLREEVFNKYYDSYISKQHTLSSIYSGSIKSDVFFAKIRNYNSSLEASLSNYNIPKKIYINLIETVNKNVSLMHKYIKLRKSFLKLDELHMYDLYTPIVKDINTTINYDDAKNIILKALQPLGKEYINIVKKAFNEGWIDVYENEGKRSGAYSWGAYGTHPFILLNFDNKINDMFTLAHEIGHAIHSYYTWETQPYVYGDYTIFLAEIASTVNEALLMDYLLKTTEKNDMKKYLLNYFMEQFKGTLFRQTMFAEFEMITHDMIEKNEALTVDSLNNIYRNLNIKYYGNDLIIDDKINYEWSRIPHFYNSFYVYQYATGYSAAIAFSKNILENGELAVKSYINFLKNGSSDYSMNILKKAGLDMTSPKPIEDAMSIFKDIINKFESFQ